MAELLTLECTSAAHAEMYLCIVIVTVSHKQLHTYTHTHIIFIHQLCAFMAEQEVAFIPLDGSNTHCTHTHHGRGLSQSVRTDNHSSFFLTLLKLNTTFTVFDDFKKL